MPYSYEIMMKLKFTRMVLPDLRTLSEGGGKLTDDMFKALAEYAEKAGKRFCATFGTTETSARMAYLPPEMARLKTGSIGKAIPEGELFLLDVNGNEIEEPEAYRENWGTADRMSRWDTESAGRIRLKVMSGTVSTTREILRSGIWKVLLLYNREKKTVFEALRSSSSYQPGSIGTNHQREI